MLSIIILALILASAAVLPCMGNQADSLLGTISTVYVKTQFAGNIGLASVGVGKPFFNDIFTVDLNYGYLPKRINGVSVHTLALKPAFNLKPHRICGINTGVYIGASVNYSRASNTYLRYPDYFPDGYYLSNAFHVNPFMGFSAHFTPPKNLAHNLSVFAELGTVDFKLWYAIKNNHIKFKDILNLCFGVAIHQRK